jgi:hypothetical protein
MATVLEGGAPMMLCVQMTATPAEATLGKEVAVTLSSMDGTGTCTQTLLMPFLS